MQLFAFYFLYREFDETSEIRIDGKEPGGFREQFEQILHPSHPAIIFEEKGKRGKKKPKSQGPIHLAHRIAGRLRRMYLNNGGYTLPGGEKGILRKIVIVPNLTDPVLPLDKIVET